MQPRFRGDKFKLFLKPLIIHLGASYKKNKLIESSRKFMAVGFITLYFPSLIWPDLGNVLAKFVSNKYRTKYLLHFYFVLLEVTFCFLLFL